MATGRTLWTHGGKRSFDLVVGGLLFVLGLPVLLVAAALIKLTSPGPVLFLQDRAGWKGRVFKPWKFRTMRGGRRPDPLEIVPLSHPDITPVGRFLRRLKLDELPQLVNVLRGEMSLVGPRPTLPDQAARYDDFRRRRLLVRPGLTGLAQVNGSASISWDERILYDVAYVRRCSLGLDLVILIRTILVVVLGEKRMTRRFANTSYARFVSPPQKYFERSDSSHPREA
jgi:lipopolysaccharide/colanic/teichoic acid biosynthesis glycosyltransferase